MSEDADREFADMFREETFAADDLVAITSLEQCPFCPACACPTVISQATGHVICPDCAKRCAERNAREGR